MALPHHHRILIVLLFVLLPCMAASTSHHHHGLKSLHFTLFQHEIMNKTAYIIVKGATGPGISQTTSPIGTMVVIEDPITVSANRSSKVVGVAEAVSVTSTLDGLQSITIAKVSLRMKNHKGSISLVGSTHNIKPSDHPVVGGTGDFMFVQGYVTSSLAYLKGLYFVYKVEFHLYWPPYAIKPSS
ncbi:hypothetical protein L1049_024745 [Liquidambar formosana]|uniref:Dirigent protein n=1 Tax=Liquidambar formosana TaxID=63359 RepID=A0AAP0X5C9_LIQFO